MGSDRCGTDEKWASRTGADRSYVDISRISAAQPRFCWIMLKHLILPLQAPTWLSANLIHEVVATRFRSGQCIAEVGKIWYLLRRRGVCKKQDQEFGRTLKGSPSKTAESKVGPGPTSTLWPFSLSV